MKDGLLERIKDVGYWRINIRPLSPLEEKLSFKQCFEIVQSSRVSIRGWDFPHLTQREDEHGGTSRAGEYLEEWCDWHLFLEFWRMYRSGQFLAYKALTEDIEHDRDNPQALFLDVIDAIYSISEFFEFTHRMYTGGLYQDGALIYISLNNNPGRMLQAGPGRVRFFSPKRSDAATIDIERSINAKELAAEHRDIAVDVLAELFDHFGWNPELAQIKKDQNNLFQRNI